MKVLCWNLGAAWGRWRDDPALHDRSWHWIAALDPDLAFLQEVRPPAWAAERWDLQVGPHQFFASALLTRPGTDLRPVALPVGGALEGLGSYLATAELVLPDGTSILVSSVHTPTRVAPESGHPGFDRTAIARTTVGEPWWNDVAFAGFRRFIGDRRFLIAGDWNTSRWVDEHGVATPAGAEFFDRAANAGWTEVSLDAEGHESKTWYGSTNPRTHQPDHAFTDAETAGLVRSFAIEPWPITALGLSDHAPLVLELDLNAMPPAVSAPVDTAVGAEAGPA